LVALPIVALLAACNSGAPTAQSPPSTPPSAKGWPTTGTIAVYDSRSANATRHTISVVAVAGVNAKVLAEATVTSRTYPPPPCPPPGCIGIAPIDLPYVSTSRSQVYVLDGNTTVDLMSPIGLLSRVTSVPGTTTAHAAFAVSPDDSQIAVGLVDFWSGKSTIYTEKLHGGGHVDVFSSIVGQARLADAPFYWPIGWRAGKLVLASGSTSALLNPYQASAYALIDPTAGAKPVALGKGDCVPSGTLTAAGTACVVRPGTQCLEDLVANATSPYYYNSCLRRVDWAGDETNFLLPNTDYTGTFSVTAAALSPGGGAIITDHMGRVLQPVSATHGGNNFLGAPSWSSITVPRQPGLGWIDPTHLSATMNRPDGTFGVRIFSLSSDYNSISNVSFEASPDLAPGVPGSPIAGQLMGVLPEGLG
jgi:hypothetical protein